MLKMAKQVLQNLTKLEKSFYNTGIGCPKYRKIKAKQALTV